MIIQPSLFDFSRATQITRINGSLANATDTNITAIPNSAFTYLYYLFFMSGTATTILLKSNAQTILSFPVVVNTPVQFSFGYPGMPSLGNGSGFQLRQDSGGAITISAAAFYTQIETLL